MNLIAQCIESVSSFFFCMSNILIICLYSGSKATETLFEGHQLSLEYLVRNLLKLYVDIEFTGSHTQVIIA